MLRETRYATISMPGGRDILLDLADVRLINGSLAINAKGYVYIVRHAVGGRAADLLHRRIMRPKGRQQVDHINHNRLDNRRRNLRVGGSAMNNRNRRKTTKPTSSRFKGVSWKQRDRKWAAAIGHHHRTIHLGNFDDESDAARAYDDAAVDLFGDHALTNRSMGAP